MTLYEAISPAIKAYIIEELQICKSPEVMSSPMYKDILNVALVLKQSTVIFEMIGKMEVNYLSCYLIRVKNTNMVLMPYVLLKTLLIFL